MKLRLARAFLAILLLSLSVLPVVLFVPQTSRQQDIGKVSPTVQAAPLPGNRPFDYVLIIVMENKNFSQINGSASAPYLNQLAHNYSLATKYTACDHPSLPNYMCLTGGYDYFSGKNCSPTGTCTTSNSSIVDRIESIGLTWRAYMEDMPSPCFKSGLGNYTYLTNPFIFYNSIGNNATRCASHVVPANSGGKGLPDDNLVNALGSTSTASNYMWLTPNLCDNMHNCSISRGDSYLSKLVPLILSSTVFRTQKAALIVTFDEGYGSYPTDYVYTVWAGPAVMTHYRSSTQYSHYSLTSTIESAWGLQPLTAKDRGSPSMLEFFSTPPPPPPTPLMASFTVSPANPDTGSILNFTGSATGGTQPYNFTWSFGDGNQGTGQTIGYMYQSVGNYTANLTVTDASRQTAKSSQAVSIDIDRNPAPARQQGATLNIPKTTLLLISFVIGLVLPLAASLVFSRRRRRYLGSNGFMPRLPSQEIFEPLDQA